LHGNWHGFLHDIMSELITTKGRPPATISAIAASSVVVPAIIADAGDQAARRFLEFFAATISNRNTRDQHQLGALDDLEPLHVAAYVEGLQKDYEKPSVKQHLAAIRMLFDWLVTGGVVATNPAHAGVWVAAEQKTDIEMRVLGGATRVVRNCTADVNESERRHPGWPGRSAIGTRGGASCVPAPPQARWQRRRDCPARELRLVARGEADLLS
jgi:hypothetical protein